MIVFLLHGYIGNFAVAFRRTATISFGIALFDACLKVIFIWVLRVPLHGFRGETFEATEDDMIWRKWGFWMAHSVLFSASYLGMLLLPLTRWRDLLPSKDSFHYYVRILFAVNLDERMRTKEGNRVWCVSVTYRCRDHRIKHFAQFLGNLVNHSIDDIQEELLVALRVGHIELRD